MQTGYDKNRPKRDLQAQTKTATEQAMLQLQYKLSCLRQSALRHAEQPNKTRTEEPNCCGNRHNSCGIGYIIYSHKLESKIIARKTRAWEEWFIVIVERYSGAFDKPIAHYVVIRIRIVKAAFRATQHARGRARERFTASIAELQ